MTQYKVVEYKYENSEMLENELNKMLSEGWELVSAGTMQRELHEIKYILIFRKEK